MINVIMDYRALSSIEPSGKSEITNICGSFTLRNSAQLRFGHCRGRYPKA